MFAPPPDLLEVLRGASAPRAARDLLRQHISGHPEFALHCDDALLAISELVANAIEAAGDCSVSIWYQAGNRALRVEVRDASPGMPQVQDRILGRIGGHGLRIVESVTTAWGVALHDAGGKSVWFEIHVGR